MTPETTFRRIFAMNSSASTRARSATRALPKTTTTATKTPLAAQRSNRTLRQTPEPRVKKNTLRKTTTTKTSAAPQMKWEPETEEAFEGLIRMVCLKVNGGNTGTLESDPKLILENSLMYALFAASVGVYSFPENLLDKSEMIWRRLSWVVSFNLETKDTEISYPSEGFFNLILSLLLERNLERFLDGFNHSDIFTFFTKPAFKKQFAYWQVNEVLARLAFLLALQRCNIPGSNEKMLEKMTDNPKDRTPKLSHLKNLLHPRLARDVLKMFARDTADKLEVEKFFAELGADYEGALTTFGYFQEMDDAVRPLEFVQSMLFRGSAFYFSDSRHPGADAVLPLVMPNGSLGMMLIQVKGVRENILTDSYVKKHMKLCTIDGIFKYVTKSGKHKRQRIVHDVKHCIRIIINLGSSNSAAVKSIPDDMGPVLAIQSGGKLPHLRKNECIFVQKALQMAGNDWHGKLSRYEAHMRGEPAPVYEGPYNPAYYGFMHDDDDDIVRSRETTAKNDLEKLFKNRPRNFYKN